MSWLSFGTQAQPTLQQFRAWLVCYSNNDLCGDTNYDGVLTPSDFTAFFRNYDNSPRSGPDVGSPGSGPTISVPRTTGWTKLAPSADSLVVYVSSAVGNDSNDGLSTARPVKTIARAYDIIRDGKPDWVRLRRGDTFFEAMPNWKKSGKTKAEPMVITTYGTTNARAKIYTGSTRGMRATGTELRKHLRFVGLELKPQTRTRDDAPGGIEFICPHQDILIEDCLISGYADNLQFQGPKGGTATDVRVRRSVITDSWAVGQHSQGLYAARVDGLLVEECVFDHNGWNTSVDGGEATIFNHNIYVQTNCSGVTVKGNIISEASSHGLQARPGGNITGNLFYRNSISLLLGNEDTQTTGVIQDNVFLEGKDISPDLRRGMGIHIQNSDSAKIRHNLILRNGTDTGLSEAIAVIGDSDKPVSNLLVEHNTIYNWLNNVVIENPSVENMTFRYNIVYDNANQSPAVRHFDESTLDNLVAISNTYYIAGTTKWFRARNSYYNMSQWLNVSTETNPISINGRTFTDSTRTMARYAQYQLLPANASLVMNRARAQSRLNWDEAYTAGGIVSFFKAGYTLEN